jgi:selenocysteine-specific elongation factor
VHLVATAGHVDHGKSSLVEALTGTNPDRLEEERRRGMTIDLGFAFAEIKPGISIAFVDVPGHERFVATMLAGVHAARTCLFVVDAREGWRAQSEEHLRVLDALGTESGVVAVTKADTVDAARLREALDDVASRVKGTFLDGAPIVATSTSDPATIEEVRRQLSHVLAGRGEPDLSRPRLWVDRSFAVAGAGTVVTGSLVHGSLAVGDDVVIEPQGTPARIRGIQRAGADVMTIGPGQRCALNLTGVGRDEIGRGDAVVSPGTWWRTTVLDARLTTMSSLEHDVTSRGDWVLHVGTAEVRPRIRLRAPVSPGGLGLLRAWLPHALPLAPGDRFVLRETGRDETVGIGTVLDVDPVAPLAAVNPDPSPRTVVAARGWVPLRDLPQLVGRALRDGDVERQVGEWATTDAAFAEIEARLVDDVSAAGDLGADAARLDARDLAVVRASDRLRSDAGRVRTAGASGIADHPYLASFERAGCAPPDPDGLDRAVLSQLVRTGALVSCDNAIFHPTALVRATAAARDLLAAHPNGFTVSALREALGITRKHAVPLAEHLDREGITRRRGDVRVAGPRLDRA